MKNYMNVKQTTNMLLKCDLTCPAFLDVEMVSSSTMIICASFVGHNHKLSFTFPYDLRKEVSVPFA